MSTAENAHAKIEKTEGFHNAMIVMATRSNNLMLAALHEFEARGLKNFTNKELIGALNAIGSAWERVEKQRNPNKDQPSGGNRLAGIFKRTTVTETAVIPPQPPVSEVPATPVSRETIDADFVETVSVGAEASAEDMDF